MEDDKYDRNMFGIVYNSDGSIKKACGVIPMIGIFLAAGAVIVQSLHIV
jgi:hypothetical protein